MNTRYESRARPLVTVLLATAALAAVVIPDVSHAQPPAPSKTGSVVLDRALEVHGGVARWRQFQGMTYRLRGFPLTPQTTEPSLSTVDLVSRWNRIESPVYTIGFDGKTAWSLPTKDASGLPTRFYTLGSFYFIGMPFVFADGGAAARDVDDIEFQGKKYRGVEVTYGHGTGYSEKDDYTLLIDPQTYVLRAIHHSVTEAGIQRVTWAFDQWQSVDGVLVPARFTFWQGWNPASTGGKETVVTDVKFTSTRPEASLYAPPAGAVVSFSAADAK